MACPSLTWDDIAKQWLRVPALPLTSCDIGLLAWKNCLRNIVTAQRVDCVTYGHQELKQAVIKGEKPSVTFKSGMLTEVG